MKELSKYELVLVCLLESCGLSTVTTASMLCVLTGLEKFPRERLVLAYNSQSFALNRMVKEGQFDEPRFRTGLLDIFRDWLTTEYDSGDDEYVLGLIDAIVGCQSVYFSFHNPLDQAYVRHVQISRPLEQQFKIWRDKWLPVLT